MPKNELKSPLAYPAAIQFAALQRKSVCPRAQRGSPPACGRNTKLNGSDRIPMGQQPFHGWNRIAGPVD